MKVALFVGGLSGGGAERAACGLASYLAEHDVEVTVVTMTDDTPSYHISPRVGRYVLLKESERKDFLRNTLRRLMRMLRFLRGNAPDCLVSMSELGGVLLPLLKSWGRCPVVVSERSNPNHYPRRRQRLLKRLARRVDHYICLTPDIADWFRPYVQQGHISVIPNAINPAFVGTGAATGWSSKIVSVGRLSKEKNYPMQIRAFARIAQEFGSYQLVIYGEGAERESLQTLCRSLGVENRVRFAGFSNQVQHEIADARLFVFTSNFEGMPNVLIEAMSLGLPVIATDCEGGACRYLVENGVNGILIDRNDEEALVAQMTRLLRDDSLSRSLAGEARKIKDRLSPDTIYPEWMAVLSQLTGKTLS